jgi:hypothetical protein
MEWGGEPPTRSGEDSSGRGSLRSSAVEQFMAVHGIDLELPEDFGSVPSADRPEGSTASPADALAARGLAPGALRDATVFDPDPRRVLAGLAYANLTLTHNLPEDIDEERISILRQIEREVRRRLRLAPSEAVFRTGSVDTSRGTVGMGRLIAYPRAAVITRTVREILIEDGADFNPDGTTHRIWRLLWALRFAGAMPHRRGQATRVWHTYVAGDERILIDVYYSHLRDVRGAASRPGAPVALGAVLATVGTTGNSVSTHLHLEIKVKLRDRPAQPREIGALLPHEFFPLATDFRRPARRGTRASRPATRDGRRSDPLGREKSARPPSSRPGCR